MRIGYKASAEQFGPRELVDLGVLAEQTGLDSVWLSDHFQPWRHEGGHAPYALAVLAVLFGVLFLTFRSFASGLYANPVTLQLLRWASLVLGGGWALLFLDAWRLGNPSALSPRGKVIVPAIAFMLALGPSRWMTRSAALSSCSRRGSRWGSGRASVVMRCSWCGRVGGSSGVDTGYLSVADSPPCYRR